MKVLRQLALNSLGVVRTFPKSLAHGPRSAQGLGISHLYTIQGVKHYSKLAQFSFKKRLANGISTPSLIRTAATRSPVGLNGPLFTRPFEPFLRMLTPFWLVHFWQFLSRNGLTMYDTGYSFTAPRQGDRLLTRCFLDIQLLADDMYKINLCRLWLRALFISDLTGGLPHQLDTRYVDGQLRCTAHARFQSPNVPRPPKSFWDTWRHALQTAVCTRNFVSGRRLCRMG